jgi:hypothetical protein
MYAKRRAFDGVLDGLNARVRKEGRDMARGRRGPFYTRGLGLVVATRCSAERRAGAGYGHGKSIDKENKARTACRKRWLLRTPTSPRSSIQ